MSWAVTLGTLFGLLFLSATYSGSETGIYSVSRLQLDVEAEQKRWSARLLRRLLQGDVEAEHKRGSARLWRLLGGDAGLLVALLIGNNLMLEVLTHRFEYALPSGVPVWAREITVALVLTPVVFLMAELVPKDLFRRRPLRLLSLASPLLLVSRILFLPLSLPIQGLSRLLERRFGLDSRRLAGALRREEMFEVLQAGRRAGALTPRAEALAQNVLVLRETPLSQIMVPWERVLTLDLTRSEEEIRRVAERSDYSRLPVVARTAPSGGTESSATNSSPP